MNSFFLPKLISDIIEFNPYAIGIVDTDGRFVMANNAMYRLLGTNPSQDYSFFNDTIILKSGFAEHLERLKNGESIIIEELMYNPHLVFDKSPDKELCLTTHAFPLRDDAENISHYVFMYEDVTQKKKAEARQQQLVDIVEHTSDFMGIFDVEGNTIYLNSSGRKMYGFSKDRDLSKIHLKDFFPNTVNEKIYNVGLAIVEEKGLWSDNSSLLLPDGSEIPTIQVMLCHRNERNVITHYSLIIRDISEHEKEEAEINALKSSLYHSEKLAFIGTLASGIAHEINNPLSVASGFLEILNNEMSKAQIDIPLSKNAITRTREAVLRIEGIVKSLKNFARVDRDAIQEIDVHQVISESIFLVADIYKKDGISIITKLEAQRFKVLGNKGKFQQVLMNLSANARDAINDLSPPIKTITIATKNISNVLQITVEDTGIGISKQNLVKIFDQFFTTKEDGKGTGLGLAIVKSLLTSMNGIITVESEEKKGSKFIISFNLK